MSIKREARRARSRPRKGLAYVRLGGSSWRGRKCRLRGGRARGHPGTRPAWPDYRPNPRLIPPLIGGAEKSFRLRGVLSAFSRRAARLPFTGNGGEGAGPGTLAKARKGRLPGFCPAVSPLSASAPGKAARDSLAFLQQVPVVNAEEGFCGCRPLRFRNVSARLLGAKNRLPLSIIRA